MLIRPCVTDRVIWRSIWKCPMLVHLVDCYPERERGTSGLASTQTKREEQCGGAIGVLFAAAASIDSKQLLHTILRYSARSMLSVWRTSYSWKREKGIRLNPNRYKRHERIRTSGRGRLHCRLYIYARLTLLCIVCINVYVSTSLFSFASYSLEVQPGRSKLS